MDSSDDEIVSGIPPEIFKAAEDAKLSLLPAKSKRIYDKVYDEFVSWCKLKNVIDGNYTENVFLAFFLEKSKCRKPSSLWSYYSMLKATVNLHNNINIARYSRLITFLKRKSDGYKPRKSKILTREEIELFLVDAPDNLYLMIKVALIFGICGACRREELANISIDDIQDLGTTLLVTIRASKTKIDRIFSVIDKEQESPSYLDLYRKYASLRTTNTNHGRFFVYYRNGKCSSQVVGKNTFGQILFKIATYLKLPTPKDYTGHCFRRSSATLLANAGEDILNIKRHAGWKSTTVAEGYIEDSVANKMKIAKKIVNADMPSTSRTAEFSNLHTDSFEHTPSSSNPNHTELVEVRSNLQQSKVANPNISISNCSNCVISIKL